MADLNALGTVFALTLDDRRQGIGQVVGRLGGAERPFYVAVFEGLHDDEDVDAALDAPVVLLALTMDMLLKSGAWRILGRREIAHGGVALPASVSPADRDSSSRLARPRWSDISALTEARAKA